MKKSDEEKLSVSCRYFTPTQGLTFVGRDSRKNSHTHASKLYSIPSESFANTWICSDSI